MRRSMLITAVVFSSLSLFASGAHAASAPPNPALVIAAINIPAITVDSPGRATPARTADALAKALNAADGEGVFALHCAEDQRLFATVFSRADFIDTMSRDFQRYRSKVTVKRELPNKMVPLVIAMTTKSSPVTTQLGKSLLSRVGGNWCLYGLRNVAYANADASLRSDLQGMAQQLSAWAERNPSKTLKPFIVNAENVKTTNYINGDKAYPVWLSKGSKVVVTRVITRMKDDNGFCLSGTSLGSKNPTASLVYNSTKGGHQPAGAGC